MNKKFLMMVVCSFSLVTACANTEEVVSQLKEDKEELTLRLNENEKKQKELNQRITELEKQNETNEKEKELFSIISNLSKDFVSFHTSGHKEKIKTLISDELFLEEKDNTLYLINNANDQWLLYPFNGKQLDDWVIQGFQYDSDSDTYLVHIREFYKDENGEPVSPPTFLNLTFKSYNNEWKVISVSFDI
ncbi:hypothetical protein F7731_25335 [Cytobacillus depressus]|uniref:Uncharacterized protein n=1 Tax=Cytobacillus depressus TaxID=1602942 RepID=A0A6L3UZL7_9BACI|nr:hypothetical protein [Cytobacillus depressus]KAB2328548.1 hypothetical protein F7731_25335 [Cytobacillus depressus]